MPGATLVRRFHALSLPQLERHSRQPLQVQVYRWLRQAIWRGNSLYAHS